MAKKEPRVNARISKKAHLKIKKMADSDSRSFVSMLDIILGV